MIVVNKTTVFTASALLHVVVERHRSTSPRAGCNLGGANLGNRGCWGSGHRHLKAQLNCSSLVKLCLSLQDPGENHMHDGDRGTESVLCVDVLPAIVQRSTEIGACTLPACCTAVYISTSVLSGPPGSCQLGGLGPGEDQTTATVRVIV
jgi:hypothetical protein